MPLAPTIIQSLFAFALYPESRKFSRLQQEARKTQESLLLHTLRNNQATLFGKEHGFTHIHNIAGYRKQVPVRNYQDFVPYIQKLQQGQKQVLTAEPVLLFHPTGGTTGTKLIPYTRRLKQEFQQALAPWLVDVFRDFPRILLGKSYWTISPPGKKEDSSRQPIQTGFDEDSSYLGWKGKFLQQLFAVPSWVTRSENIDNFRFLTLFFLLQAKDLSWMSLWSPTFFLVLLDEMDRHAELLLSSLYEGMPKLPEAVEAPLPFSAKPQPQRAKELEAIFRLPEQERYARIWPKLAFISLWKDAYARHPADSLARLFPNTYFQGKGLLATEGVMTIPLQQAARTGSSGSVPAFRSHFLEFLAEDDGEARCLWELEEGKSYSVLLTTGGGFYRYEIGDLVRVEGFYQNLPLLRFIGRKGRFFDFAGEKLAEQFVNESLDQVLQSQPIAYSFLLLAPEEWGRTRGYALFLESSEEVATLLRFTEALEKQLRNNFHYKFAVEMKQLTPLKIFLVSQNGQRAYVQRCVEAGQKLGDIKPLFFDTRLGWQHIFQGRLLS